MASTNVPLTSIGLYVGYAAVTSSDTLTTIPTTTFTHLPGLYSTPDFNIAPNTADATSYDEEEFTMKVTLLKEMPDNVTFGARYGKAIIDAWEALLTTYNSASNKGIWFVIAIKDPASETPTFDNALFFRGRPLKRGLPSTETNSGIDFDLYVAPESEPEAGKFNISTQKKIA